MIYRFQVSTRDRESITDITDSVSRYIEDSGVSNGYAILYTPHTTCGLTINENYDPDVKRDIIKGLKSLKFEDQKFDHFEGNSPAHIKSSLMGFSLNLIIENGHLLLGRWQGIMLCEFDGPRQREIIIKLCEG